MNLILLFEEDFVSKDRVCLSGRRKDHITDVLSVAVGDEICVGLLNGKIGTGKILKVGEKVELQVNLVEAPGLPLPVTLIIPMIRPLMFKRLLFHATTLGIKKIIILNFNRVEKSLWKSSSLKPEAMREQLILGLEQAKDTILPEILIREQFKPFVEDELSSLSKAVLNLVAHPGGLPCPSKPSAGVTLVIGPEGGIIPYELDKLGGVGFKTVGLGPRILRVDTALPYIIGKLF